MYDLDDKVFGCYKDTALVHDFCSKRFREVQEVPLFSTGMIFEPPLSIDKTWNDFMIPYIVLIALSDKLTMQVSTFSITYMKNIQ